MFSELLEKVGLDVPASVVEAVGAVVEAIGDVTENDTVKTIGEAIQGSSESASE